MPRERPAQDEGRLQHTSRDCGSCARGPRAGGAYFQDGIVIVGGQVPDLLVANPQEPHVRSIDIDLAFDSERLTGGRYAELVKTLLDTKRYSTTNQAFKFQTSVDLDDGDSPILVDVDFLKPPGRWPKEASNTVDGFRPLDATACATAFLDPKTVDVNGLNTAGAQNTVRVRVTNLEGFLIGSYRSPRPGSVIRRPRRHLPDR